MAYLALTSLIATIELQFLPPCRMSLLDHVAAVKSLNKKLHSLQAFLDEDQGNKDLQIKIRDFALDAEDRIEIQLSNFLLTTDDDDEYKQTTSQELRQTLREASRNAANLLNIINSNSNESDNEAKHSSVAGDVNVINKSRKLEDRMVIRHHDCGVIKDKLCINDDWNAEQLIAIVGMVGIGKTTLAKKVYRDPSVASHFEIRSWIDVPREYNRSRMLRELLRSIKLQGDPNEIVNGSNLDGVAKQVRNYLLGKKYLIVLDNVWNKQACYDILHCLPCSHGDGSRVLITTRYFDSDYFKVLDTYVHRMSLLDPNESWDLFRNALSLKENVMSKFEEIRSDVVEKCDGLPQLIVVVNTKQLPEWSLNAFANSCRWLSFYTHSFDYCVLFRTNNPRSIFFFHENHEAFMPLKLLRVLVLVPSPFLQRVPTHLGDLVFLRYLSVTQWSEGLNYIVSTNPNLQTLVVSRDKSKPGASTLHLPSTIWELPRLRHLELGNMYRVNPPSTVKENLQTLSWVSPTSWRKVKEVYYKFPNIRKLKIFYKHDLETQRPVTPVDIATIPLFWIFLSIWKASRS